MMPHHQELAARKVGEYLDALASSQPAPGGGSVAGLVGALAAGLGEMVASLTPGTAADLAEAATNLSSLRASALASGEADELAYSGYLEASRLPRTTPEEKARRRQTMQEAIHEAANVPLELAATGVRILNQLRPVIDHGNRHVLSDAAIAVTLAHACVDASLVNVRVNLPLIKDQEIATAISRKGEEIEAEAARLAALLRGELANRAG